MLPLFFFFTFQSKWAKHDCLEIESFSSHSNFFSLHEIVILLEQEKSLPILQCQGCNEQSNRSHTHTRTQPPSPTPRTPPPTRSQTHTLNNIQMRYRNAKNLFTNRRTLNKILKKEVTKLKLKITDIVSHKNVLIHSKKVKIF